jgi:23S rRNA pseudouridine1911/1915/1917 synthase
LLRTGRVDKHWLLPFPDSLAAIAGRLIDLKMVKVDLLVTKASHKVKAGSFLTVELQPTPQSQAFKPESMSLHDVVLNEYLCVINKPPGLVVHPAPRKLVWNFAKRFCYSS